MTQGRILVAVNEPGSANALAPVLEKLQEQGLKLSVFASGYAAPCLEKFGVESLPIKDAVTAESLWGDGGFDLVLVGTSLERSVERPLVRAAKERGIPTMTVIDHWANYWERFTDPDTGIRLDSMPDVIAVMDELARDDMAAQGVPVDRIVVTGQPYLEQLPKRPVAQSPEEIRGRLGIREDESLITFVSEVLADDPPSESGADVDYPDGAEIATSIQWIARGLRQVHQPAVLAIKPHPLGEENIGFLNAQVKRVGTDTKVVLATNMDGRSLVAASIAVTGLTSMLLLEAAYLGIPTLSVWPAGQGNDHFIGKRLGIVRSAYSESEVATALREMTSAQETGRNTVYAANVYEGATEAVVILVRRILNKGI